MRGLCGQVVRALTCVGSARSSAFRAVSSSDSETCAYVSAVSPDDEPSLASDFLPGGYPMNRAKFRLALCGLLLPVACGASSTPAVTPTQAPSTAATPTAAAASTLTLGAAGFGAGPGFRPLGVQLVTNATKQQAETVDVKMTLSNAAGTVLDTEDGYAGVIRSGQTVGIVVDFLMNPSGGASVKTVTVAVLHWAADDAPGAIITASGATYSPPSETGLPEEVKGTVTSKYPSAQQNVFVAVACLGSSGHIIGVGEGNVAYVPANGAAAFDATANIPVAPARCDAWAYPGVWAYAGA